MSALVSDQEFADAMRRLGPFAPARSIAVAVSGGPDSLALALLAARWGRVLGLIVDHGLRAQSAAEARWTADILARHGIAARILTLRDLPPGPALAERARIARYTALIAACREAGLTDLLLGHHRRDQAETLLMRWLAGSGESGLAAMPAVLEQDDVRLLRPLLDMPPGRLRANLAAIGQGFIDDPSNRDPRWQRAFLRRQLNDPAGAGPRVARLAHRAERAAVRRIALETEIAGELAAIVTILPEGCAMLECRLSAPALARLLRCIAGSAYLPPPQAVAALAKDWRAATLHGCRIMPAGRLAGEWVVGRELAAIAPNVDAHDAVIWDGRFRLRGVVEGSIGRLGMAASRARHRHDLPAILLAATPALWQGETLLAAPFLHRPCPAGIGLRFAPAHPLAAAPFFRCGK